MKRRLRDDPLFQLVRAHGFADVMRALGFAAAWAVTSEDMGREPTLMEYRDWWLQSERTTYREQAAFRKVTGMETPALLVERARQLGYVFEKGDDLKASGIGLVPVLLEMGPAS